MKNYTYPDDEIRVARSHPWTRAISDPSHRYYDFNADPGPIRIALEDFVALGQNEASEAFYELVEWLNSPVTALESNDCGAGLPRKNTNKAFPKGLECTARLMILYRHLPANLSREHINWLEAATQHYLTSIDPLFEWAVVGTSVVPANYISLPIPESEQAGHQLVLRFWAWGDNEVELMSNLARAFRNTTEALIGVSREVTESANSVNGRDDG